MSNTLISEKGRPAIESFLAYNIVPIPQLAARKVKRKLQTSITLNFFSMAPFKSKKDTIKPNICAATIYLFGASDSFCGAVPRDTVP